MEPKFKRGDQIAYVPTHAGGNLRHPDVEYGFVTSQGVTEDGNETYFCRYWRKGQLGTLGTRSNSQYTPVYAMQLCELLAPQIIEDTLKWIEENNVG